MKKILFCALLLCSTIMHASCSNNGRQDVGKENVTVNGSADDLEKTPINIDFDYICSASDSAKVVCLLTEAPDDTATNYMIYFAEKLLGIPYVAHTLEVGEKESLVVNLRQLDCTTYVESCTALTICKKNGWNDFGHYITTLKNLRYHNGEINGYPSRLHYFTEWIKQNSSRGLVEEIQGPNPPFTAVQTIDCYFMTQNPKYYKQLKDDLSLIKNIRENEEGINGEKYRYIPKNLIGNNELMRKAVNDGDIIAIITSKKGLDTSHLGIALWHDDGLHLMNASQIRKKTVDEPKRFVDYLKEHPTQTGIRVIRLK